MKHYAMETYSGVDVYTHVSLTSALVGGKRSASRPGRFTPGYIESCLGPRTGLDGVKKRILWIESCYVFTIRTIKPPNATLLRRDSSNKTLLLLLE
jgi:hypothetical protein